MIQPCCIIILIWIQWKVNISKKLAYLHTRCHPLWNVELYMQALWLAAIGVHGLLAHQLCANWITAPLGSLQCRLWAKISKARGNTDHYPSASTITVQTKFKWKFCGTPGMVRIKITYFCIKIKRLYQARNIATAPTSYCQCRGQPVRKGIT